MFALCGLIRYRAFILSSKNPDLCAEFFFPKKSEHLVNFIGLLVLKAGFAPEIFKQFWVLLGEYFKAKRFPKKMMTLAYHGGKLPCAIIHFSPVRLLNQQNLFALCDYFTL